MIRTSTTEREEALEALRKAFPKGSTVYTILRKVSRSGVQRHVSVVALLAGTVGSYIPEGPNQFSGEVAPTWPSYWVSKVTGYRYSEATGHNAVVVNGCGTDAGFEVAYSLAYVLWGDGYALKHRWL